MSNPILNLKKVTSVSSSECPVDEAARKVGMMTSDETLWKASSETTTICNMTFRVYADAFGRAESGEVESSGVVVSRSSESFLDDSSSAIW